MKKFFSVFLALGLILTPLLGIPAPVVNAGTDRCEVLVRGSKAADSNITIVIDDRRPDSNLDKVYSGTLFVYGSGVASGGTSQNKGQQFAMQDGTYSFGPVRLQAGDVIIEARGLGGSSYLPCSNNPTLFKVLPAGSTATTCEIRDLGKISGTPNSHNIVFTASNLPVTQSYIANLEWQGHKELLNERFSLNGGSNGFWSSGVIVVELTPPPSNQLDIIRGIIKNNVTNGEACRPTSISIAPEVSAVSPGNSGGSGLKIGKPAPCVQTDLGCIPTDPGKLASAIFSIILGLAGGLAVLMIIVGGFKVATSQGNVDALQDGRDTITKAITGLAFILLATTILGIIGIDILGIPFFSRDGAGIIIK